MSRKANLLRDKMLQRCLIPVGGNIAEPKKRWRIAAEPKDTIGALTPRKNKKENTQDAGAGFSRRVKVAQKKAEDILKMFR